ncbi:SDR family NAD(P)-dependent oxidoreductase [Mangrovihabitans endophyticus]|uniref:Oxidoreductase n=1 Tax=Mangrovihabitans endophyticus TaxID=1751298 RepID=A0A8J3FND6_9ACTN|nr:SDR family NAD(P)-dependent oxidoreductase [Mangrovihabitans endophyticus]GGK91680.1 oxidoreductase [Mangrovihabitans endophyticus]
MTSTTAGTPAHGDATGDATQEPAGTATPAGGIDPARLALCLDVLAQAERLPVEHPDAVAVRRATSGLFKTAKMRRRRDRRDAELAADRAVTAATATGAPGRIDDETAGLPLRSPTTGTSAGTLRRARGCYICKVRYREVDAFYHQLCPPCAALNHARREARTDLTGRRALLTGGRAKIGMYIALRLLRDGADLTITTRFPHDAARRFAAMPDRDAWMHRLRVVGIDLRDPAQVVALADSVAQRGPLDILINNAAQTVRRSPGSYAALSAAEADPLPGGPLPELEFLAGRPRTGEPATGELATGQPATGQPATGQPAGPPAVSGAAVTALALAAGPSAVDAGGLLPDLAATNSWSDRVHEVPPTELLEVQLCNVTAPFILVSRLRAAMIASRFPRRYVVNVSAMEGVFSRGYKGAGHPHTNMAKAALNMLTRTSAADLFADGILMTSVDTGWITDERPHPTKMRLAEDGFHAPLDLSDGAARVYDPIVRGELGEDVYGCFLKDYAPDPW